MTRTSLAGPAPWRQSRRAFMLGAAATGAVVAWPRQGRSAAVPAGLESFSFDALSEAARGRAAEAYAPPQPAADFVEDMTYAQYRQINFDPERSRWRESDSDFRMQAFHMGWLFEVPVTLYEIVDGATRPFEFTSDDFIYRNEAEGLVGEGETLPGVSGFRLTYPLNRADIRDELVVFQGASYFRALGRGNAYGLSARGLAIDTAVDGAEEFPRFSAFYLQRPAPGDRAVTIYADLDSESVAGAYRFVITPGQETTMDVTARLFFRDAVSNLGVAPLTSMFLFDETNRGDFDDYRPQVHDSNGLQIRRAGGEVLWRSLANPPRLGISYFSETSPRGFGLHQRDREFEEYQDADAHYQDRPSVDVDFIGDWGEGAIRLVEIPSELEINDNIVAYWTPEGEVAAGEAREYRYRLRWGMLAPDPRDETAYVFETRSGAGGVSGVKEEKKEEAARKFVVDFKGGRLGRMPPDAEVSVHFSVARGEVIGRTLSKLEGSGIWRFVIDVVPEPNAATEIVAFVEGYGEKLSETWLYQWINSDD